MEKISLLRVGIVVLRSISGGHHAAQRLDAQRQRGDVEQQDVLDVAAEHARLDRRADGHDLVRVDALVGLLADELLLTSSWTAGMRVGPPTRTTSSISSAVRPASFSACFDLAGPLDQVVDELLEASRG